jgi:pimeloyl-ACP methyl ester carboxylesterase
VVAPRGCHRDDQLLPGRVSRADGTQIRGRDPTGQRTDAELAEPERRDVPGLQRVERLDASHWVQHDEPETVNRLLAEFFSS